MTRHALRCSTLAAWLLTSAAPASAAEFDWTIQCFQGADATATRELITFADRLKEETGGRIDIAVLPAGAVVPNDETPRAINAGLLQGHYNTPSYFARLDPAFAVLGDTLSAYVDPEARDKWFSEGGGLTLARKLYAKNGLFFIGSVYWPADRMPAILPIDAVADLRGLRIRSPGGLVGDLLQRAGAEVVQLPTGQIHEALETGSIDATDWAGRAINRSSGLYDVASYDVMLRHSMVLTEISVGLADWQALPDDLKPIVEAAVRAHSDRVRAAFRAEEDQAGDALAKAGVTSIEWDETEADKFRALLFDVWEDWRSRSALAAEIVDSQRAYLQQIGLN